jgi:hypothetical protein
MISRVTKSGKPGDGCGGALQSKLQIEEQTRTKAYHLELMVFSDRFPHHPGKFSGLI